MKLKVQEPVKTAPKETKPKTSVKKKEEPPKFDNNALETGELFCNQSQHMHVISQLDCQKKIMAVYFPVNTL